MSGKTSANPGDPKTPAKGKSGKATAAAKGAAGGGPMEILPTLIADYGKLEGVEYTDSLDLILFSHLVLHMPLAEACRSYQRFKTQLSIGTKCGSPVPKRCKKL